MNLYQRLDAVCPGWQRKYSADPEEAAIELGLIEPADDVEALNFSDDDANLARALAFEEDMEAYED